MSVVVEYLPSDELRSAPLYIVTLSNVAHAAQRRAQQYRGSTTPGRNKLRKQRSARWRERLISSSANAGPPSMFTRACNVHANHLRKQICLPPPPPRILWWARLLYSPQPSILPQESRFFLNLTRECTHSGAQCGWRKKRELCAAGGVHEQSSEERKA